MRFGRVPADRGHEAVRQPVGELVVVKTDVVGPWCAPTPRINHERFALDRDGERELDARSRARARRQSAAGGAQMQPLARGAVVAKADERSNELVRSDGRGSRRGCCDGRDGRDDKRCRRSTCRRQRLSGRRIAGWDASLLSAWARSLPTATVCICGARSLFARPSPPSSRKSSPSASIPGGASKQASKRSPRVFFSPDTFLFLKKVFCKKAPLALQPDASGLAGSTPGRFERANGGRPAPKPLANQRTPIQTLAKNAGYWSLVTCVGSAQPTLTQCGLPAP